MLKAKRLIKSFYRLLLPIVVLIVLSGVSASIWLVHTASRPQTNAYLVTPEKYGLLSSRASQVTDEKWSNRDGTPARGWLLRGMPGAPAVILVHKYGANRSHELNLGVKLSEGTNFTVLMPDLRGHGDRPQTEESSFGGSEADDIAIAISYLRSLKAPDGAPLVGEKIGVYGVEMGGLAALGAAASDASVRAVALDSVPPDAGSVLSTEIDRRFPFASFLTTRLARLGANIYFYTRSYNRTSTCEFGKAISGRRVMLLAGFDAPELQDSTARLGKCIQGSVNVDSKYDLSPSGYSIMSASMEKSEAYDQRVIDFFRLALAD
jgi:pimeloyl-ACP methyl ester carboxylesterase